MPKFELNEVSEYYVYYVHILGIPEDLFWNADIGFLQEVADCINAFENWKDYAQERMLDNG